METTSPEEKLLQVIRGGGKAPAAEHATEDAASALPPDSDAAGGMASRPPEAAAVTPPPRTAPEPARSSLKLKTPMPATGAVLTAKAGPDDGVEAALPDSAPEPEPVALTPFRYPAASVVTDWKHALALAGKGLFMAAALMVALALWAAWGHARIPNEAILPAFHNPDGIEAIAGLTSGQAVLPDSADSAEPSVLESLEDVLQRFRERPLFVAVSVDPRDHQEGSRPPPRAHWEQYARNNLRLLGLSVTDADDQRQTEAIVADTHAGTMFYLKTGDFFLVDGERIRAEAIEHDHLVISDTSTKVILK